SRLRAETQLRRFQSNPGCSLTMSRHKSTHFERGHGFATLDHLLANAPWFSPLETEVKGLVQAEMWEQSVPANIALLRQGELPNHWYGVIGGLLKWSTTTVDGRSTTFGGMSPGSWFGEGTVWRGLPVPADVIALQPSVVA